MVIMHAAAVRFDLHIPDSRSLKAKRAVVRPIVEGMRHRFHVSVAEMDYQDQWQRARIGVAVVAESDGHLREVARHDRAVRGVARPDVELLDVEIARWLDSADERDRGASAAPELRAMARPRAAAPRGTRACCGSTRWCARRSPTSSSGCPIRASAW